MRIKYVLVFFNEVHIDKNDTLEDHMVDLLLKKTYDAKNLLQNQSKHEKMTMFKKQLECS